MPRTAGFTLTELMVTLTVASILMMVAAPSFREFLQSNRMSTQVNLFISSLNIAKSEGVKGGARVTMCKSSNLIACTTSGGWEQGWLLWTDKDKDGVIDENEILQTKGPAGGDLTIRGNYFVKDKIIFTSSGNLETMNNGTVIFCDSRIKVFDNDKDKARSVILSMPGRIRTVSGPYTLTTCTPS